MSQGNVKVGHYLSSSNSFNINVRGGGWDGRGGGGVYQPPLNHYESREETLANI